MTHSPVPPVRLEETRPVCHRRSFLAAFVVCFFSFLYLCFCLAFFSCFSTLHMRVSTLHMRVSKSFRLSKSALRRRSATKKALSRLRIAFARQPLRKRFGGALPLDIRRPAIAGAAGASGWVIRGAKTRNRRCGGRKRLQWDTGLGKLLPLRARSGDNYIIRCVGVIN
jgi:hypothetical protein